MYDYFLHIGVKMFAWSMPKQIGFFCFWTMSSASVESMMKQIICQVIQTLKNFHYTGYLLRYIYKTIKTI